MHHNYKKKKLLKVHSKDIKEQAQWLYKIQEQEYMKHENLTMNKKEQYNK